MKSQADFYLEQLRPLIGGKITALTRSGPTDDPYDMEFIGFIIKLSNGKSKSLVLLSDDEGNGPGSFEISDEN